MPLGTAFNPWVIIFGFLLLLVILFIISFFWFFRKNKRTVLIGKIVLLIFGLSTVVLVIGTKITFSKKVTIINPLCNTSNDFSSRFWSIKMNLLEVETDKRFSLHFPINGYEGSYTDVFNKEGKVFDRWYASNFCILDGDSSEAFGDSYDGTSPIIVKYNFWRRIKGWQLIK